MNALHRIAAAGAICLSLCPTVAHAYSSLFVFGDSLSDVGNVFLATGGQQPASPYANGQFSNGPIWAQLQSLGMLLYTEGRERTVGEYEALLKRAGFAEVRGARTPSPADAVLAVKR